MRRLTPNTAADLDRVFDESFDVIEDQFPDFGTAELHRHDAASSDNGAGSERQYAYCKEGDPIIIAFAEKAYRAPVSRLRGLMRHEFGHALEYRFGVKELERRLGVKLPAEVERRADAIAEAVWGEPIVYDKQLVQCVGVAGVHPRPAHLPDQKEKLKANGARKTGQQIYEEVGRRWLAGDFVHPREVVGDRPDRPGVDKARWVYDVLVSSMDSYQFPREAPAMLRKVAHSCHLDELDSTVVSNGARKTGRAYHASMNGIPEAPREFRSFRGMDYGPGLYFGTDPQDLLLYGDRLYAADVELNNPLVISQDEPPDDQLVKGLQKALGIDSDMLRDYPHPLVGIFSLAKELHDMGELRFEDLIADLQEQGYDGVYVDGAVVNEHQGMDLKGDYFAIWSPEQISSWSEVSLTPNRRGRGWKFEDTESLIESLREARPDDKHVSLPNEKATFSGSRMGWAGGWYVVEVPVERVMFMEGNHWNFAHAAALEELISDGERPVFNLPAARLYRISEETVRATQEEDEEGELSYQRGMAEPWDDEDAGTFSVQLLDGNHRALAALAAGEDTIFVTVGENYREDVRDEEWVKK